MDYKKPDYKFEDPYLFSEKDIPNMEIWYKAFCYRICELATFNYTYCMRSHKFFTEDIANFTIEFSDLLNDYPRVKKSFKELETVQDQLLCYFLFQRNPPHSKGRRSFDANIARYVLTGLHLSKKETGSFELFRRKYLEVLKNNFHYEQVNFQSLPFYHLFRIPSNKTIDIERHLGFLLPAIPFKKDGGNPHDPNAWGRNLKKSMLKIIKRSMETTPPSSPESLTDLKEKMLLTLKKIKRKNTKEKMIECNQREVVIDVLMKRHSENLMKIGKMNKEVLTNETTSYQRKP